MDQNWKVVLRLLYEKDLQRNHYRLRDLDIDETHPLVELTRSLSLSEFQGAVRFLDRNGLIEDVGEGTFQLTQKGFEVARDSEFRDTQNNTNTRIGWLTFIIAVVEIVNISTIIPERGPTTSAILGVVAILLTLLAVSTLIKPNALRKLGG
ncbi:hypothetical protein PM033_14990 [Halorubrum ezzemoulense]|uniref:hypothetical protein n=1 Tax=Halorubrum ezzemoulense TaxID=337243 RepID=UPI00232CC85B|nr:hypothetical protein [Halorubrum ezzemoulense]MDB2253051.1 hypothetical protein [Halorubrum ezzemoulense]